jgi:hypothetical protein
MASILEANGGGPQKQPKYVPIFIDRTFTGLFTQRNVLHDPSDVITAKYYGGRPDALWQGLNIELTNRLTLQRRPGLSEISSYTYPTPPLRSYSFQLTDGTIQLIVDTQSTGNLVLTSCNNNSGGNTVYNGTITGGGSNAYVGMSFIVAGFQTNLINNGTFTCVASSSTTLTLSNPNGIAETIAATANSAGAVYWDKQNGSVQALFYKSPGAGQTYFQGVGGILYMGDGVDTRKYTPLNPNLPPGGTVSVWNWGIVAPSAQPTVTSVASGSAATKWQANTIFSTMGLTVDTNATPQIWQLIFANADGTNTPNAQFGTAGAGSPTWNQALYATTTEGSGTPIIWKNLGEIDEWQSGFQYGDAGIAGTAGPVAIWDATSQSIYMNFNNGGSLSLSGTHKPAFNGVAGSSFWDHGCHWFFVGKFSQIKGWVAGGTYSAWYSGGANTPLTDSIVEPLLLPPPTNQPVYVQVPTNAGTAGTSYAPFPANAGLGTQQPDAQLLWLCLGQAAWQQNFAYAPWTVFGSTFGCIKDTNGNMQVCLSTTGSGLSAAIQPGTTYTLSAAANTSGGNTVYTGTFATLPPAGTSIKIAGFVTHAAQNNGTFTVVSCTSTQLTVTNNAGIAETNAATATFNPWGSNYGDHTTDGNITWTCVSVPVAWVGGSSTTGIWNLPPTGFQPPQSSQSYGGSTIDGNTSLVETVIVSGKSGSSTEPSWGAINTNTLEGPSSPQLTWYAESVVNPNSLAWTLGLAYAYSFKARAFDDFYSPTPLGDGQTPPGSTFGALGAPWGSATNAISTASPAFIITGANSGSVNTITGLGSTDPQVDTIVIWRSADGGGEDQMFELTEIPAPKPIGGIAQPWSFQDFLPDTATNQYPGLNTQIPAPIAESNNPPFSTFLPMAYNFQRIWGADGSDVPFSGGPDVVTGNPNEAFAPADSLPFLAPVVRLVKTAQGLVTFLTDSIEVIAGGPLTSSFFSVTWAPGIGLLSYNALDLLAGEIYFFSADNQFRIMTPSLNVSNAGFAIGDQLANQPSSGISDTSWDPAQVYVASHQNGIDNCIMVADGNTGWYRLNPRQAGAQPNPEAIWSPYANITNGCQMVQSVETTPGIKKLLVGGNLPGQKLLYRNLNVFTDDGTQYGAYFVMGSIMLAHPGQLALLKFMEFDFSGAPTGTPPVGFRPTISYLLNEISGSFTSFSTPPQFDPPSLYGPPGGAQSTGPTSYSPNRYYFLSNASLARCRHMQLKVDYGTTSNGDEIYNATIFGRLMIET